MQKIVLTNEGFNLLNTNHSEGQSQYWIGYYGLAYVPEGSALSAQMKTLTQDGGDNIYNVFQGSMTTAKAGIDTDISDTAAYNLANECMYSANVMSRFRYVLDDNDNNQLVIFADNRDLTLAGAENLAAGLVEYAILRNNDEEHVTVVGENDTGYGITKVATLPLPAPLYYGGEPKNYSALDATLDDTVTHDTRSYSSSNHALAQGYDVGTPGIDGEAPTSADKFDYVASRGNTFSDDVTNVDDAILDKSWQLQSVSNFNRFHAPTNAEGYRQGYEPACRNMAKVTKLFPIDHYDVISTTESDTNKVATVKYTVNVDLRNSLNAISNRSTPYYRMQNGTLSEVSATKYKAGFKFNRIGIYAVQTALHAYNTEEDAQEDCTKHHLQMQVIGDSDPVLVAVMDLATPIVLSEDGICEYSFDFQINFTKPESQLIDDAAIYYNLYEDDAITWYKNQLIANASTAEAVTSLGVQMAYLRQQINQYTGAGTSSCGIVDEDNRYALEGHTHPYMKNIVDSNAMGNGATRGVDTQAEDTPITIYQSNGQSIVVDEHGVPHYSGKPESTVPLMVNTSDATTGDDSLNLGKDSATLGTRSINMSNYGILGENADSTLLMGGIGKADDQYNDNHLVISTSSNSFVNIPKGEISSVSGSIITGEIHQNNGHQDLIHSGVYSNGIISESLLIGYNNVFNEDITPTPLNKINGQVSRSALLGNTTVSAPVNGSIICGTDTNNNPQHVGEYDVLSDMNAYAMDSNHIDDQGICDSVDGRVTSTMAFGVSNTVSRNITGVYYNGNHGHIPSHMTNSILIGDYINRSAPGIEPNAQMIMSVEEFNERYGQLGDYPENDPLYYVERDPYDPDRTATGQIIVVGSGELKFNQGDRIYTRNVRGITLYINYYYTGKYWDPGYTVGTRTSESGNVFDIDPYKYTDLYTTGGHSKNMLIMGDYTDTGLGSENSIIMGDHSGSRKITAKNSFMNFLGDTYAYDHSNTLSKAMVFDNVWWIGAAGSGNGGDSLSNVHVISNNLIQYPDNTTWGSAGSNGTISIQCGTREHTVYKDAFVFRGDNPNVFNHAYWYDALSNLVPLGYAENTSGWTFNQNTFYQPVHAPMIYTGGLALGGYGTNDTNFMLLKIGTQADLSSTSPAYRHTNIIGRNGTDRLVHSSCIADASYRDYTVWNGIIRSSNPWGPWDKSGGASQTTSTERYVSLPSDHVYKWYAPQNVTMGPQISCKAINGSDEQTMPMTGNGTDEGGLYYTFVLQNAETMPSVIPYITVTYNYYAFTTSYFVKMFTDTVIIERGTYSADGDYTIPTGYELCGDLSEIEVSVVDDGGNTIDSQYISVAYSVGSTRVIRISIDPIEILEVGHTATATLHYKAYNPNGNMIYNVHDESSNIDHYMTDSPFAGMVLMVQDKQELDGTLHVGLGSIPDSARDVFGCNHTVYLKCQYISNSQLFGFYMTVDGGSSASWGVNTLLNDDKLNQPVVRVVEDNGLLFNVSMTFTQANNTGDYPDTSSTPIKCTINYAWLSISMDESYFVSFEADASGTSTFALDSNYYGEIYLTGGRLATKPTYMYMHNVTSLFAKLRYFNIGLSNSSSVLSVKGLQTKQISSITSNTIKITPLDFCRNKQPIYSSTFGGEAFPVYIEEVNVDSNDDYVIFETTSAV